MKNNMINFASTKRKYAENLVESFDNLFLFEMDLLREKEVGELYLIILLNKIEILDRKSILKIR